MRQVWEPEDLLAAWTLVDADWELVANKSGATRLGFALLLKFFEIEARFPRTADEIPRVAVVYVARQVQVPAEHLASYDWSGRSITYHRVQIREAFGFREATREDETRLSTWLADEVCPVELNAERMREALWARCRHDRIEPPGRVDRIIGAAQATFEEQFCARTVARLSPVSVARLETLLGETDQASPDGDPASVFSQLKADPGRVSLETLLREIDKLHQLQAIGLPTGLFADASEKLLAAWRARAAVEYPAWMRRHPEPVRVTLLAVLCWTRTVEIIDALVELLIALVNKINTSAERRVEGELIADLKRVRGKEAILFALAEAAVDHPDDTVRQALFPVVGEATLRDLVREAKATKTVFATRVRTVLRASYSHHYRRGVPKLLSALEFRCNNTAYRPVMGALELLARSADRPNQQRHYDAAERIPVEGVVPETWHDAVLDEQGRVARIPYELCALAALRDALRRREIWA